MIVAPAVVICDVDGVFNNLGTYARCTPFIPYTSPKDWLDGDALARMDAVCAASGAVIVLSSAWRLYHSIPGARVGGLEGTREVLRACGLRTPLVDATPDTRSAEERAVNAFGNRGQEILAWVSANPGVPWVAVDDLDVQGLPDDRFVRTNIRYGFTPQDADRLLGLLRRARRQSEMTA